MVSRSTRLPSRFPVGTKFVIESRRGGEGQAPVFSRHLEFPDGTKLSLPSRPVLAQQKPIDPKAAPVPRRKISRARPRPH